MGKVAAAAQKFYRIESVTDNAAEGLSLTLNELSYC